MVREYLNVGNDIWNWDNIFDPMADNILSGETEHKLKFLEPRMDFFKRHESQFEQK